MQNCLRRLSRLDVARSNVTSRSFVTSCNRLQAVAEQQPGAVPSRQRPATYTAPSPPPGSRLRPRVQRVSPQPTARNQPDASATDSGFPSIPTGTAEVGVFIDNEPHKFSAVLLRDICTCQACVDTSTKQKLFSSADIPLDIRARAVAQSSGGTSILWDDDVPGYPRNHTTEISSEVLRSLTHTGYAAIPYEPREQVLWNAEMFAPLADIDYEAYMQDDAILYKALQQLHSHGLLFVSNVPESEKSVSTIGERIGPIKNTFYGYTWDVRSVPEAINVAYTSQDLGFHMDLLYMHQPPHLQLLHCIRSSAQGGASLFTDSYRAANELFQQNVDAFFRLSTVEATFHYDHPETNLYRQQRPVFEMKPLREGGQSFTNVTKMAKFYNNHMGGTQALNITDWIEDVNWSPPFQGPLALPQPAKPDTLKDIPPIQWLNLRASNWHASAREYSALIHRPEGIYERMMRPGECVIFDNRRVLHARKAFEVGDAGTERWLRGAYLDKDPYMSKLRVLQKRYGDAIPLDAIPQATAARGYQPFEQAAAQ